MTAAKLDVPLHERVALTPAEAGALVGRSESFIRRQLDAGRMRRIPASDTALIARAELDRWAQEAS